MSNVTELKTEAQKVADIKDRARAALLELCALSDEARAIGAILQFQIVPDNFGRHQYQGLALVKVL